jgi:mannose-1-phosphate guanylyltransferase/mannose-6-phosphate isomerase
MRIPDSRPLFQAAVLRVLGPEFEAPVVITNIDYRFIVAEQLREVGVEADIILEPVARDSCAAIAVAAAHAIKRDPSATILVIASDHAISDQQAFVQDVVSAAHAAEAGKLVCFGIAPTFPSTGYGYIQPHESGGCSRIADVARFVEKPPADVAAQYIAAGYLWNSGNFVFRASVFLEELERYAPEIKHAAVAAVDGAARDLNFIALDQDAFAASPKQSVDYAVMEHTERAAVIAARFDWSDIGSWTALGEYLNITGADNLNIGDGLFVDSSNSMIYSPDKLTVLCGVEDVIVINTTDACLVVHKDKVATVKQVVQELSDLGRQEALEHRIVHRPWGHYQSVDAGQRYQVKRIIVNPDGKLSLQSHMHRSEHWVVVRGTAKVTVGEDVRVLSENQSLYIPLGEKHRLENPGKIPLELIEVQTGPYLGEDDIIRYDDVYKRV